MWGAKMAKLNKVNAKANENSPRKNCHDIWWNAFMVRGVKFCKEYDIPFCPTTAKGNPKNIINSRISRRNRK